MCGAHRPRWHAADLKKQSVDSSTIVVRIARPAQENSGSPIPDPPIRFPSGPHERAQGMMAGGYHIADAGRVVLLALPVVQVVLFGFAIRTDVNDVRLAIVDPAPDRATIELRNRFASSGVFRTVAVVSRTSELDPLFETGAAQQAVVFEPGFANDLGSGDPAHFSHQRPRADTATCRRTRWR